MNDTIKSFVLGSLKQVWTTRYQEQCYRARWVQPDERREPRRQADETGGKEEWAPVFRKGAMWMLAKPPVELEIVPVEKMAERVLDDWAKAKSAGTSQQDFGKEFCRKYEGARMDDVEFLVRVIEDMITPKPRTKKTKEEEKEKKTEQDTAPMNPILSPTSAKGPRNRNLEKEKEKEHVTAPRNPILLEVKEKDAKKRKRLDEEDDRPRKPSKKEKKSRPQPPPDSEDEDDDSIKVLKKWHKKTSRKGGWVWEKLVQKTLPDGTTRLEHKSDHKDELTDGMHNYHGSRQFAKYNKRGTTSSGWR